MLNPRRRDKPAEGPEIRPRVKLALESFLMLQTYFGGKMRQVKEMALY